MTSRQSYASLSASPDPTAISLRNRMKLLASNNLIGF
jgi:hypothetical protein